MKDVEFFNAKLTMLFSFRKGVLDSLSRVERLRLRHLMGVLQEGELGVDKIPSDFIDTLTTIIRTNRQEAVLVDGIIEDVIKQFTAGHVPIKPSLAQLNDLGSIDVG